jgi:DNA invertase Pin-like site-specific DNA recombinase
MNLPKLEDLKPLRNVKFEAPNGAQLKKRLLRLINDAAGEHPSSRQADTQAIAVGYTRVSSAMQLEGSSLEDQEERLNAYIQQQGWTLYDVIDDPAASGRSSNRNGFRRLKRLIQSGQVQVLVVDRLDRIARHLHTFLRFIALLRKYNVELVSLREDIDFRRPWGKLVLYILGALAEFYSNLLAEEMRIKRAMQAKDGQMSSSYRLGYCMGNCSECTDPNGKNYCPHYGGPDRNAGRAFRIPHPVEAHAVRLMFSWYATGQYSFADIARRLNEEVFTLPDGMEVRFRTKGRPGYSLPDRFDADAVRYIVSNPIYPGFVGHAGSTAEGEKFRKARDLFRGEHTPLVDVQTFERAQLIRRGRFNRSHAATNKARPFPLSRILICAHRHGSLRPLSTGKYQYYRDFLCKRKYGEHHQQNLKAEWIAQQVRATVEEMELPESWVRRILGFMLYDEGEDALARERVLVRERLEREKYLLRERVISPAQFNERRRALTAELVALQPEAPAASQEALRLLDNLAALLQVLEPEEENLLYRSIFSAIIVEDDEIVDWEVYPPFVDLHPNFTLPGTHEPLLGYREPPQHPA